MANARNVSFSISVRWSIYIINSVDKPNFRVSLPHRRSTTVAIETNPFYTSCSDISQKFPKVAHFTKKLLKSCFLSTQKNQFLLLMKVNLCRSIRIIQLFIYSFLLADISLPTEMIFYSLHLCILFYISFWESVLNIGYSPSRKIMLINIQ